MANREHYKPEQIIEALKRTRGRIVLAAEILGCEYHTVENYMKRYASVAEALRRERERELDITELKLSQAIDNGEAWAIQFKLKTLGRSRGYIERHEITGKDGDPLHIHLSWGDASYQEEHDSYSNGGPPALTSGSAPSAPESSPL